MECIFQNYWGYSAAGCHSFSIHLAYQCPWVLYMIPTVIFFNSSICKAKEIRPREYSAAESTSNADWLLLEREKF